MSFVSIHDSGQGGGRLRVDSYFNGLAYNFSFGEAGSPMRNIYLQGDDAAHIRAEFDAWENREPEKPSRHIWLEILGPYL